MRLLPRRQSLVRKSCINSLKSTLPIAELPAVTIVVPTRNRAYTIRQVASSWYTQACVNEIIFVDDAGSDETPSVIAALAQAYPAVRTTILRNDVRVGAAESRNRGALGANNAFLLFCDDDMHLGANYALTCLRKLLEIDAGAVSGRLVYMDVSESVEQALRRFGSGPKPVRMFQPITCTLVHEATLDGDVSLPLTNPVIVTRTNLVTRYGFDRFYTKGNGYREESDFQMNLFVNGHPIIVTNDCHSFHINSGAVKTGGQRVGRWNMIFWPILHTNYFYRKYWARYSLQVGLRTPRYCAVLSFATYYIYVTFIGHKLKRNALGRAVLAGLRRCGLT